MSRPIEYYNAAYSKKAGGPPESDLAPYYWVMATLAKGKRCLDISCGSGWVESFAPEVVGTDFALEGIKSAKERGGSYFVVCDSQHLPFRDKSFELAICLGSIEHFPDQQQAVLEMVRTAEIYFVTVEARLPPILEQLKWYLVKRRKSWQVQPIDNTMTQEQLTALFSRAGARALFQGVWRYWDIRKVVGWVPKPLALFINKRLPDHVLLVAYSDRDDPLRKGGRHAHYE